MRGRLLGEFFNIFYLYEWIECFSSFSQDEIQHLQNAIDRLESEKRQLESLAAEQAETCAQLNEANNSLSACTLTLADEAAKAPEMVRKQLETQLNECELALDAAQNQRIALLDELNEMQTENANLRAQLRARKWGEWMFFFFFFTTI